MSTGYYRLGFGLTKEEVRRLREVCESERIAQNEIIHGVLSAMDDKEIKALVKRYRLIAQIMREIGKAPTDEFNTDIARKLRGRSIDELQKMLEAAEEAT